MGLPADWIVALVEKGQLEGCVSFSCRPQEIRTHLYLLPLTQCSQIVNGPASDWSANCRRESPKMFSKALWEVVRDVGGGLDAEVEVEEVKNSQDVDLLDDWSSSFGQEVDP